MTNIKQYFRFFVVYISREKSAQDVNYKSEMIVLWITLCRNICIQCPFHSLKSQYYLGCCSKKKWTSILKINLCISTSGRYQFSLPWICPCLQEIAKNTQPKMWQYGYYLITGDSHRKYCDAISFKILL